MPTQGRNVASGYPALPFYVNDHGLDSLFSVTVKSGEGIVKGGQLLEEEAGSRLKKVYTSGPAVGILLNRVDATSENVLASMMVHGVVRSGSVFGYDAAAAVDLPFIKFV